MNTKVIKTVEELEKAKQVLINSPVVAYDTETTGLRWYKSKVFMHSFSNGDLNYAFRNKYFKEEELQNILKAVLQDKSKIILGQNIKFDRHHLRQTHGIEITAQMRDTMLMSHLMDENNSVALKPRVKATLGFDIGDKETVDIWLKENLGARDKWDFSLVPESIMDPYSGMDPYFCFKLNEYYWPSIQKNFSQLFETDMKVFDILYKMEFNGLPIDIPYLKNYQSILEQRIETNKQEAFKAFGIPFDIDSPMEVAEVLYKKMKLPVPKITEKGGNSTDDEALSQIDHPVARALQTHRGLSKLLTTYVLPLQEQCVNGKIHPDYGLTRTKTGRFSCSDPNAQNFAKNEELRRAFTVDPGEEMIFWDQSQIEMVGCAMYSKDPKMTKALIDGADLHSMTAKEVLGKSEVTKEERAMGKGCNFAMIYCVGKAKLARYLSEYVGKVVTDQEAAIFKSKYLQAFPSIYNFQRLVIKTIESHREPWGNFIKNKFGRVRRIDPQKAYTGVNHLIQGWAADLMKASMVKIDEKFHPKWRQNIHDAIRIDVPTGDNSAFIRDISNLLTNWPEIQLPINCTVERSTSNWAETEEIKL